MGDRPLLWRAFDAAERAVAPRLEGAVRSREFLDALGLATRARARVQRELEARSRRLWHALNLPAGSDVNRLRRQVADLDRELRQVNAALERALETQGRPEEESDADAARSRPPGRRAQRAPSP